MNLKVLGCHGGESKKHRTTSFLLDDHVAIDAGAVTRALTLAEQEKISTVLVSHAHLDHVRDLATIADNRCQTGGPPLEIVGIADTIDALRTHFFNDRLWPDFSRIPTEHEPTIVFRVIEPERPFDVGSLHVTPVRVHHTIDTVGFFVDDGKSVLAYSGDTGPTDRFWEHANATDRLSALLLEVSFPDALEQLAIASQHLTPTLAQRELEKLASRHRETPVYAYHVKPVYERETHREIAQIRDRDVRIFALDDVLEF